MNERESDLAKRTSLILQKDTKQMNLNDIISELVDIVERYERALKIIGENANWVGEGKVNRHIQNVGFIASLALDRSHPDKECGCVI